MVSERLSQKRSKDNRLKLIFRALESRNYRLFFLGQGVSLIGTWMQQIAMGWMVYRLTHSPFLLGLVGFASQIPSFILSPFSGVMTDRWNRHRLLILTQTLAMFQAFALAILSLTESISVGQILGLSAFLGLVNSLDYPVRQSFIIEMVDHPSNLANAIALNSSLFNSARLIGPPLAGALISLVGEGWCFFLNGVSYLAVILALLAMQINPQSRAIRDYKIWQEMKEGFVYVVNFLPIRSILLLMSLSSLVAMPYTLIMPVFAKDILHGDSSTLGFLLGSAGCGALAGALFLAARKSVVGLGRLITFCTGLFGCSLIVFSLSRHFWISLLSLLFAGFGMMVQMAGSNTILQTIAEEDKRGRLMSFYALAFVGLAPFGSLLAGGLSARIGAPATLAIGGSICLLGTIAFARALPRIREHIRPIYRSKGILPEIAEGLQTASAMTSPPEKS